MKRIAAVLTAFALAAAAMPARAIEEPAYEVVQTMAERIEVRQYAGYTVAEVVVPGPAEDAGNAAFPILAGYIFGKNKGERKLAMTAPVTQTPTPPTPVKLDMTAPVTQTAVDQGFVVQFVLPKGVNSENAPEPEDARVMLRDVAPKRVAVIRYSGFWSTDNYARNLEKLQQAVRDAGLQSTGEAVWSRYDPPFMPWFLRRNEIWLAIAGEGKK